MAKGARHSRVGVDAVYGTVTRAGVPDYFTWGDNSFTWYTKTNEVMGNTVVKACAQLNAEGVTYNYIAFGIQE
jgi:hypothetical protein